MLRKRAWSRSFYSGTAQFDEEIRAGLASEWQSYDDLQYLVCPRSPSLLLWLLSCPIVPGP